MNNVDPLTRMSQLLAALKAAEHEHRQAKAKHRSHDEIVAAANCVNTATEELFMLAGCHLQRLVEIAVAANNVVGYDWSDNDSDSVVDMNRLDQKIRNLRFVEARP